MYRNLKFLHMTDFFSTDTVRVSVTNIRYECWLSGFHGDPPVHWSSTHHPARESTTGADPPLVDHHPDTEPDQHHDGDGELDDGDGDVDDNDNAGETSSVRAASTRCDGDEGRHRWVSIPPFPPFLIYNDMVKHHSHSSYSPMVKHHLHQYGFILVFSSSFLRIRMLSEYLVVSNCSK